MRPFCYETLLQSLQLSWDDHAPEQYYSALPGEYNFTTTERRLLEVLLQNDGNAVSTKELSQKVFGEEDCLNELKVYIRHLRQKIEEPIGIRVIETVRGVGYRFRSDRLRGVRMSGVDEGN